MPRLADRETYEAWLASGRRTIYDRAREDLESRLAAFEPSPPAADLAGELRDIMTTYARPCGLDGLPSDD